MHQPPYPFTVLNQFLRFDFLSVGKTIIAKSIVYSPTDVPNLFSLALVDVDPDGSTSDLSVSDNGDMEKVLLTVYRTFTPFFEAHPGAAVFFEGSTPSRNRLYRIAIAHELADIGESYQVWGVTATTIEPFQQNRPYVGFLLSQKGTNIAFIRQ